MHMTCNVSAGRLNVQKNNFHKYILLSKGEKQRYFPFLLFASFISIPLQLLIVLLLLAMWKYEKAYGTSTKTG